MKQKGFTLIELLVTMGIIAVLTGMAVFNFNQARVRARDVSRKSDLGQLRKAIELYKNDNLTYPVSGLYLDDRGFQGPLIDGEYMDKVFSDPKGDDWAVYQYVYDTVNKRYYLMACLENKADSTAAELVDCDEFDDSCACGGTSNTGVMYIVSNP